MDLYVLVIEHYAGYWSQAIYLGAQADISCRIVVAPGSRLPLLLASHLLEMQAGGREVMMSATSMAMTALAITERLNWGKLHRWLACWRRFVLAVKFHRCICVTHVSILLVYSLFLTQIS